MLTEQWQTFPMIRANRLCSTVWLWLSLPLIPANRFTRSALAWHRLILGELDEARAELNAALVEAKALATTTFSNDRTVEGGDA